jgi:hypothetical protein
MHPSVSQGGRSSFAEAARRGKPETEAVFSGRGPMAPFGAGKRKSPAWPGFPSETALAYHV